MMIITYPLFCNQNDKNHRFSLRFEKLYFTLQFKVLYD